MVSEKECPAMEAGTYSKTEEAKAENAYPRNMAGFPKSEHLKKKVNLRTYLTEGRR